MTDEQPVSDLKKIKIVLPEEVIEGRTGEVHQLDPEDLLDEMEAAGWSNNPGQGKAVLLPDGSELLNPVPIAPPVDYDHSQSAFDLWQANLQRMANIRDLGGGFLIDENDEEANDFDVDDPEDFFVRSEYEMELVPEVPAIGPARGPVEDVSPDQAKAQAVSDGAASD